MDMLPYILAGVPLAIVLRLGIWWLGERARRRRRHAERVEHREADMVAAAVRHKLWLAECMEEIDAYAAKGMLTPAQAEELKSRTANL